MRRIGYVILVAIFILLVAAFATGYLDFLLAA